MTTKVSQWQRIALLAAGISASMVSVAWGGTPPLYQTHWDGSVWQYTGAPCNGGFCPGWTQLDSNPATTQLAAAGGQLYQLHYWDGSMWMYTGQPCTPSACAGWVQIYYYLSDTPSGMWSPQIMVAANGILVQEQENTSLWQFTGRACNSNGTSCPGWIELDDAVADNFVVGAAGLLEQRDDNSLWLYTGPPCTGSSCPGWRQIDGNPNTLDVKCQWQIVDCTMASGVTWAYQLWSNGAIWQYIGPECDPTCRGWREMDNNPNTKQITAGNSLYEIHNDGSIWQSTGTPCNGGYCAGWWQIDNNSASNYIVAGPNTVYQAHTDGSIWQYVGPICNGPVCSGWIELDNNSETSSIVPGF